MIRASFVAISTSGRPRVTRIRGRLIYIVTAIMTYENMHLDLADIVGAGVFVVTADKIHALR